ncbi:MAG: DnaJ domain-containing protein [Myxococcota bacterium]
MTSGDADAALARIDRFYETLDRKTHFELLGVESDSNPDVLRSQFLRLARDWHGDAFGEIDLGDRKRKLDAIFQRINEAYETLKDPDRRDEYMTLLERQRAGLSTDVASVLRAEAMVDDALASMRRSAWLEAKKLLQDARSLNPDDPLYLVYLAWTTYMENRKSSAARQDALRMLKKATESQENLSLAYQYAGQIHFDQEEYKEAIKWWKRCRQYEGNNIEAIRGLRLAQTRLEKQNKGVSGFLSKLFGNR